MSNTIATAPSTPATTGLRPLTQVPRAAAPQPAAPPAAGDTLQTTADRPSNHGPLTARIGEVTFTNVQAATEGLDTARLRQILDGNRIDEIYLQTADGRIYIAHGTSATRGALADLDQVKPGYLGRLDGQRVTVLHVENEDNTMREGALSPLRKTLSTIKSASQNGFVKGITEIGGTATALVIGKQVLDRGIAAAQAAPVAAQAAEATVQVARGAAAKAVARGVGTTVKEGLRGVAVAAGVAAIVVGAAAGSMAVIGAIRGATVKPNFGTLQMATDQF